MENVLSILEKVGYKSLINNESMKALQELSQKLVKEHNKSLQEIDNDLKNDPNLNTDFSKGIQRSIDSFIKISTPVSGMNPLV
jgi:hypothetical protein